MDFSDIVIEGKLPPVTPGEILLEDFLKPMGITQYRLAKEIGVSPGIEKQTEYAVRPGLGVTWKGGTLTKCSLLFFCTFSSSFCSI
jgi:hypothetical protein